MNKSNIFNLDEFSTLVASDSSKENILEGFTKLAEVLNTKVKSKKSSDDADDEEDLDEDENGDESEGYSSSEFGYSNMWAFFGVDSTSFDEIDAVAVPVLDTALNLHVKGLPTDLLVSLIDGFYKNVGDNFKATLVAIRELINRKDVAGQTEVAKIYFKATCYYDGGHRYWEGTVQDKLIDTFFPQF